MPVSLKARLKPYFIKKRGVYYPRGTFPIKLENGEIIRKRDFYGSGSDTKALCQQDCDRLNAEIEAAVQGDAPEPTFEEAVETYIGSGGDARFLGEVEDGPRNKLLDYLGRHRVDQIDTALMVKAATVLYPKASAVTLNRQLYTPVISVLRLASDGKRWKPSIKRPAGYAKVKPAKAPPEVWFSAVLPKCRPQMVALILFCTTTSRRAGEAIRCLPEDFSPEEGTVYIGKDKNGDAIIVRLAQQVIDAIMAYNWQAGPGLFGHYTAKNRRNVFRDLKKACEKAGVKYYTPHKAGRHAFAKRFLNAGHSLPHLMGAGGWKGARVPAELYGHFTFSEVAEAAKRVGEKFLSGIPHAQDNVVELPRKAS